MFGPNNMNRRYAYGNWLNNNCSAVAVELFWFVVIVLVVWLLLQFFKPTIVQRKDENGEPNGQVDVGMVVLISFVVAVVICLLICLFNGCGTW